MELTRVTAAAAIARAARKAAHGGVAAADWSMGPRLKPMSSARSTQDRTRTRPRWRAPLAQRSRSMPDVRRRDVFRHAAVRSCGSSRQGALGIVAHQRAAAAVVVTATARQAASWASSYSNGTGNAHWRGDFPRIPLSVLASCQRGQGSVLRILL